jgi:hypothetical protein
LVKDSEYSQSAGAKLFGLLAVFISFWPWWVAPPNPGGKLPGMVGPINCARISCSTKKKLFLVGGKKGKKRKTRKSCPKGPDRFFRRGCSRRACGLWATPRSLRSTAACRHSPRRPAAGRSASCPLFGGWRCHRAATGLHRGVLLPRRTAERGRREHA